jgi:hypothetical protein
VRRADIISAGLVTVFGLIVLFVIIPIWVPGHAKGDYGMRAQDMPLAAATLATALAALFFVWRILGRGERSEAERRDDETPPISRRNWMFLLRSVPFLIAMVFLFNWLGFLATGPVTIAGFMIIMGERRPVPIVVTSICATGGIWLFFWQLLRFPLP